MPITQSRMLALLYAAQDYQQALNQACEMGQYIVQQVMSRQMEPLDALRQLQNFTPTYFLSNPTNSISAIAAEASHFTEATIRYNNRLKYKVRELRGGASTGHQRIQRTAAEGAALPPQSAAPQEIYRTSASSPLPRRTLAPSPYVNQRRQSDPYYGTGAVEPDPNDPVLKKMQQHYQKLAEAERAEMNRLAELMKIAAEPAPEPSPEPKLRHQPMTEEQKAYIARIDAEDPTSGIESAEDLF